MNDTNIAERQRRRNAGLGIAPSTGSNLQRLDALLNALIDDAATPEQIHFWHIKRDFKRSLDDVDDDRAELLAGVLLRRLAKEAA